MRPWMRNRPSPVQYSRLVTLWGYMAGTEEKRVTLEEKKRRHTHYCRKPLCSSPAERVALHADALLKYELRRGKQIQVSETLSKPFILVKKDARGGGDVCGASTRTLQKKHNTPTWSRSTRPTCWYVEPLSKQAPTSKERYCSI